MTYGVSTSTDATLERLSGVPKADLHCHFPLGARYEDMRHIITPLPEPDTIRTLDALESYLTRYVSPALKSRETFEQMTRLSFQAAALDTVTHLEITVSAAHAKKYDNSLAILAKRIREIASDLGDFRIRLYVGLRREYGPNHYLPAIEALSPADGFDGIDLTGDERSEPISSFQRLYAEAKRNGLHRKAHCGEFGTADDVLEAVTMLDLDAVQHGITAADSPTAIRLLSDAGVPLHLAPASNHQLRPDRFTDDRRLLALLDGGVCVTVNTDDLLIFRRSISEQLHDLTSQTTLDESKVVELASKSIHIWHRTQHVVEYGNLKSKYA